MNAAEHNLWGDLESPLFQNFPVPLLACQSNAGKILGANAAAVMRYGYSSDQLLDMTLDDLTAEGAVAVFHTTLGGAPGTSCARVRHASRTGEQFEVELHFSACRYGEQDLLLVAVSETTRHMGAAARLHYTEELNRALIDECPFGIFRINLETDHLEVVNPALIEAGGY